MAARISTQVVCRAEGRADQRPLKFRWQAEWLEVLSVVDEWLERGPNPSDPTTRRFRVTTSAGPFELCVREPGWVWKCQKIPIAPGPGL